MDINTKDFLNGANSRQAKYLYMIRQMRKQGLQVKDEFTAESVDIHGATLAAHAGDFYKIVRREPVTIKLSEYTRRGKKIEETLETERNVYRLTKSLDSVCTTILQDIAKIIN